MFCKGICSRYKAKRPTTGSWYASNKRCRNCEVFIKGRDKITCPCCGSKLRGIPRNNHYRHKVKDHPS